MTVRKVATSPAGYYRLLREDGMGVAQATAETLRAYGHNGPLRTAPFADAVRWAEVKLAAEKQ
jgi:hypothetical protein